MVSSMTDRWLERIIDQTTEHVEFLPVCHHVTGWKKKMTSKNDGDSSNILSFPGPTSEISASAHARESVVTAEGLLLMHAFLRIASSEDRRKVIALAEQLGGLDNHAAQE
jgi:hypothetical protein